MLFKKLNREGPEQVYRTVLNVEGATITTGKPVSLSPTAASCDGISAVIANAAADYKGFVGFAIEDIANNDYGLIQTNGLVASILISHEGTSITVTAGDYVIPNAIGVSSVGVAAAYSGNGSMLYNFKSVKTVDSATISAAAYVRGLINVL